MFIFLFTHNIFNLFLYYIYFEPTQKISIKRKRDINSFNVYISLIGTERGSCTPTFLSEHQFLRLKRLLIPPSRHYFKEPLFFLFYIYYIMYFKKSLFFFFEKIIYKWFMFLNLVFFTSGNPVFKFFN